MGLDMFRFAITELADRQFLKNTAPFIVKKMNEIFVQYLTALVLEGTRSGFVLEEWNIPKTMRGDLSLVKDFQKQVFVH